MCSPFRNGTCPAKRGKPKPRGFLALKKEKNPHPDKSGSSFIKEQNIQDIQDSSLNAQNDKNNYSIW